MKPSVFFVATRAHFGAYSVCMFVVPKVARYNTTQTPFLSSRMTRRTHLPTYTRNSMRAYTNMYSWQARVHVFELCTKHGHLTAATYGPCSSWLPPTLPLTPPGTARSVHFTPLTTDPISDPAT